MNFPTTTTRVWRHHVLTNGAAAMHFKKYRNRPDATEAVCLALENPDILHIAMRTARMSDADIAALTEGKNLKDGDPEWERRAVPFDATCLFYVIDIHEAIKKEEWIEAKQDREVAKARRQIEYQAMQKQAVIDGAR